MRRDYRVLVVDDKCDRRRDLSVILDFLGEMVTQIASADWTKSVETPEQLLAIIIGTTESKPLNKLIEQIHAWAPHVPLLLLEQNTETEALTESMKGTILSTINQPLKYAPMMDILHQCQVKQENDSKVDNDGKNRPVPLFRSLVGQSPALQKVRKLMEKVANSDVNVLVLGESGTGKEVVARNLHAQSARRSKPFVPINCGAIPPDLLESEIFGHEKGAFTGAISARKGRFELAEGGTLFLDEIGDMPLHMQVKLLRVLQERCFERVGGSKSIQTDVRIIAATHRNLETLIENGTFREDLFYRLNVFPIEVPSLRERTEDVPLLVNELTARIEGEDRGSVRLLPAAVKALEKCQWPGNIRELANLIERLAILYPNGMVDVDDLPRKFRQEILGQSADTEEEEERAALASLSEMVVPTTNEGIDLKDHLVKTELSLIKYALEECDGVVARAATFLSMRRTTLVEKMRKYGITRNEETTG